MVEERPRSSRTSTSWVRSTLALDKAGRSGMLFSDCFDQYKLTVMALALLTLPNIRPIF
jgi:hypothetical protein